MGVNRVMSDLIKVKPHYYYGYLQGFKVFINGRKFPLKNGYVYAHNKNKKAIKTALNEYLRAATNNNSLKWRY